MKLYISAVLKKYGKKQQEVADAIGLSLQTVKQTICNTPPSLSTLEKYASAVRCDVREFFFDPNSTQLPFNNNTKP